MKDEKPKLLIVEDEESIRAGLIDLFSYHQFQVEFAEDGKTGLEMALNNSYNVIILDVMLPFINGFDICNKIRESNLATPIIMLTAKDTEDDIINGLTLGADDYITKPFSVRELVLRVQALLKRTYKTAPETISFENGLKIDFSTNKGVLNNTEIIFSNREIEVLKYLKKKGDLPTSREEMLKEIWGYTNIDLIETRTVDIHIAKLRKKIESNPKAPKFIATIRGKGYRLENCS